MMSPVQYPVAALPSNARFIAYLIPTTIGIIVVRQIAITGMFDLLTFVQSLGAIGAMAAVFWLLGLASFRWAEKWTKQRGHMGGF